MHSDKKYVQFKSQRRYGIEIETGCTLSKLKVKGIISRNSMYNVKSTKYELTFETDMWHVKDDATCGPEGRRGPKGVEIASFVGKGLDDLYHMSSVADALYRAGSRVNSNCGFHIHAEVKDLTEKHVGKILAYWIKIEPVLAYAMPSSRWNNYHCRQVLDRKSIDKSKKWSSKDLYDILKPIDIAFYENDDRRVNLNLVNFTRAIYVNSSHRKTLEFRWPEGTLSGIDIRCWVRLFLNFIDTCKKKPMPKDLMPLELNDVLSCFGLNHEESLAELCPELTETKIWFLERFINFGDNPASLAYHGYPLIESPKLTVIEAKKTLNQMLNIHKIYA